MKKLLLLVLSAVLLASGARAQQEAASLPPLQVKTATGVLEGVAESGIRIYKGVPYAAPPVGSLRWKAPQPAASWPGVRKADQFGPQAMQRPLFSDMQFRAARISEDCLYLNVWTPARSGKERRPVLVYFYGGGFMAGDGSELRYDGERMAREGIVAVTVNYRLNVFGFLAHPDLSSESPQHASGNYGLLDQHAALRWVQQNIAAFGGDPKRVTIAGESAGSYSVSAQMASPLSAPLIAGAIGQSGSLLGPQSTVPLADAERLGVQFGASIGAASLAALRALPAEQLLAATARPEFARFPVTTDGYFFPRPIADIYAAGQQARVPLLLGWNSQEMSYEALLGAERPTPAAFAAAVQRLYGTQAPGILQVYSAPNDQAAAQAATDLASDRFIGFGTWKWAELHSRTGRSPVYRYYFRRPRPAPRQPSNAGSAAPTTTDAAVPEPVVSGAAHSAEIEYALGNLPTNRVYDWQPEDYNLSRVMQGFFVNFIKTGNPNGVGLPHWPAVKAGAPAPVMQLDVRTRLETEPHRPRYLYLDSLP